MGEQGNLEKETVVGRWNPEATCDQGNSLGTVRGTNDSKSRVRLLPEA